MPWVALAYELACGARLRSSRIVTSSWLAGTFASPSSSSRQARQQPRARPVTAVLLRFLAKSTSDRIQSVDEALQSIDDLRSRLVREGEAKGPSAPILGDASLIRYSTDAAAILVSFQPDLRPDRGHHSEPHNPNESAAFKEDTFADCDRTQSDWPSWRNRGTSDSYRAIRDDQGNRTRGPGHSLSRRRTRLSAGNVAIKVSSAAAFRAEMTRMLASPRRP